MFGRRVLGFDDGLQSPVARPIASHDQPPVIAGLGGLEAQHHQRRFRALAPRRQQAGDGFGGNQRIGAEQHQHVASGIPPQFAQHLFRRQDRVPGAERRFLDHDGVRFYGLGDLVHAVADDEDQGLQAQGRQRLQQVKDHRPPGQRMEDLR